jgi:hypothetical protein
LTALHDSFASTARDPARSYEPLDEADLERLGRVADAELEAFFGRNAGLVGWRERVRIISLCQGGAEHYLRGCRGVWTLAADEHRRPATFARCRAESPPKRERRSGILCGAATL